VKFNIALLPGDGVGPEVTAEAVRVLSRVAEKFGHQLNLTYGDIGGVSLDKHGVPLSAEALKACKKANAVLGQDATRRWAAATAKGAQIVCQSEAGEGLRYAG